MLSYKDIQHKLFEIIKHDDIEVKKEALWAISNATNKASSDDMINLCKLGYMEILI